MLCLTRYIPVISAAHTILPKPYYLTETSRLLPTRLREINIGALQGKTQDEIKTQFPEFYAARLNDPINTRFPGGESYLDLYERATQALEEISKLHKDQIVLIVSHIGAIRCMLSYVRGKIQDPDAEAVCNASVSILVKDNSGWHIHLVNDIEHLIPYFSEEELKSSASLYANKTRSKD